mmetsp:Transcript_1233/g.5228  ORF Transcript_1233/g.5228 Transcript_1233/m.5228 type:complete len:252 (-) Transcript_1233:839-1594(-)
MEFTPTSVSTTAPSAAPSSCSGWTRCISSCRSSRHILSSTCAFCCSWPMHSIRAGGAPSCATTRSSAWILGSGPAQQTASGRSCAPTGMPSPRPPMSNPPSGFCGVAWKARTWCSRITRRSSRAGRASSFRRGRASCAVSASGRISSAVSRPGWFCRTGICSMTSRSSGNGSCSRLGPFSRRSRSSGACCAPMTASKRAVMRCWSHSFEGQPIRTRRLLRGCASGGCSTLAAPWTWCAAKRRTSRWGIFTA